MIARRLRWLADRVRFPGRARLYGAAWSQYQRRVMGRHGTAREASTGDPGGLPVPPAVLRIQTVAQPDVDFFIWSGWSNYELIRAMLKDAGAGPPGAVLDFGCGCGRLARWWVAQQRTEVHGCDTNAELAAWCNDNLPMEARINGLEPPLPYPDSSFDLVYALSILTHLPEGLQRPWVEELVRVLRPGGHLWLTLSGEALAHLLSPRERVAFARGEPVTQFADVPGSNLCAAFHPPPYVRGTLLAGLEVVAEEPGSRDGSGPGLFQDAYLARLPG